MIEERNEIMGENLKNIIAMNPDKKILAIVGAGHEEEIIKIVKKDLEVDVSYSFSYS